MLGNIHYLPGIIASKLAHLGAILLLSWPHFEDNLTSGWANLDPNFARNVASIRVLSPSWSVLQGFGNGLEALGVSGAGRRFMMLQLGVLSGRVLGPSQGRF